MAVVRSITRNAKEKPDLKHERLESDYYTRLQIEMSWRQQKSDIYFLVVFASQTTKPKIFFGSIVQILRNCDVIFTCKVNGRKLPLFLKLPVSHEQILISKKFYQANFTCL